VHALVIASGVAGVMWLGWSLAENPVLKSALALTGGALFACLWLCVYSPGDPERRPYGKLAVPGRFLLVLEIALIIAGGAALWIAWHRAAGETYLTVAFIDGAVRYSRLATLWKSRDVSPGTER
jgi:hypothetical protein